MDCEVTSSALALMREEAARARPAECCGILLGQGTMIAAAMPARNVHPAPRARFEIDPQALVDAHRRARAGGPQVLGYYHSHPAGPPQPSAADRAMANGDGAVWAIVGSDDEVRWWRDTPRGFVPLSCTVAQR